MVILAIHILFLVLTVESIFKDKSIDLSLVFSSKEFPRLGIFYWILIIIFYGFGEQIGWRGYLLPKLRVVGLNPKLASLLMTLPCALWHLPLFFYKYSNYNEMNFAMIFGWIFSLAMGSIVLSWVFYNTNKSLIAVAFFHASIDIVVTNRLAEGTTTLVIINTSIMILGMILFFVKWKNTELE